MVSSPLAPEWKALADRVGAEYRTAIGDDLVAIALFGSVARGQARPESDVDVYVVTRRSSLGDTRLHGMWGRIDASPECQALLRAGYQPTPSPVPHTMEDLARHPWILLDITHHGIILYDPEAVLERELDAVRRRMAELGSKRTELPDGRWYWDLKPDWPGRGRRLVTKRRRARRSGAGRARVRGGSAQAIAAGAVRPAR